MFTPRTLLVWIGVLCLSGMFLMGQEDWATTSCLDADGDGYGNPAMDICPYPELDCHDGLYYVHPGSQEICDGIDNQCPGDIGYGEIDEGCTTQDLIVFITAESFTGDLGGFAGAEDKCNAAAASASLSGTYLPWLSDSSSSPSTLFNRDAKWHLVTGEYVAHSWMDLIIQNKRAPSPLNVAFLRTPINVDQHGNTLIAGNVWTSTDMRGDPLGTTNSDCSEWTTNCGDCVIQGALGEMGNVDVEWTAWQTQKCNWLERLYCFQQ